MQLSKKLQIRKKHTMMLDMVLVLKILVHPRESDTNLITPRRKQHTWMDDGKGKLHRSRKTPKMEHLHKPIMSFTDDVESYNHTGKRINILLTLMSWTIFQRTERIPSGHNKTHTLNYLRNWQGRISGKWAKELGNWLQCTRPYIWKTI